MTKPVQGLPSGVPRVMPPGQKERHELKIEHYGPVPKFKPERWKFLITGATAQGVDAALTLDEILDLPEVSVLADLHCVSRWSVADLRWGGVLARELVQLAPPADEVTHVLAFAEFGYTALLRIDDLTSPRTLLATHLNGERLTPEHGFPLRLIVPHLYSWKGPKWLRGLQYLSEPVRGFWEDRGYHAIGDAWREERYSYQE